MVSTTLLAAAGVVVAAVALVLVGAFSRLGTEAPLRVLYAARSAVDSVVARIIGGPETYSTRALRIIMTAAFFTFIVSLFLVAGDSLKADDSAGPLVRFVVRDIVFNFGLIALLAIAGAVAMWYGRWHLAAKRTAKETRFSTQTVKRLGYEVRSTDGTTPLYGDSTDSKDALIARLLRAFSDSEHVRSARDLGADDLRSPSELAASDGPQAALEPAPGADDNDPDPGAETGTGGPPADGTDDVKPKPSTVNEAAGRVRSPFAVWRLELASGLNIEEVLWRFGLPAALTAYFLFVLAQSFWLTPMGYLTVFSAAVFIGSLSFWVFKLHRRRRLSSVRAESRTKRWRQAVALAKRIETQDGTTGYFVRMGGRDYFHFDKARLAEKVADRWHQRINGDSVAPAFEEKCARNVRQMLPTVRQLEYKDAYDGRPAIMDALVEEVRAASDPDGIVPKRTLCERVVRRGPGAGHDPDLVGECYQDLVPEALYETPIHLEDTDGNEQTVVCVHLRSRVIPDDLSQIRAQFSREFSADDEALYELPEIPREALHDRSLMVAGTPGRLARTD